MRPKLLDHLEVLLSNTKACVTDTTDESLMNYALWQKLDPKGYISYNCMYISFFRKGETMVVARGSGWENGHTTKGSMKELLGWWVKTHWNVHPKGWNLLYIS